MIAMPLPASRPIEVSSSVRGVVESFNGPESAKSLGRKLSPSAPSLSQFLADLVPNRRLFQYPNR